MQFDFEAHILDYFTRLLYADHLKYNLVQYLMRIMPDV